MSDFCEIALLLERFFKERQIDSLVSVKIHFTDRRDKMRMQCELQREMQKYLLHTDSITNQEFSSFRMADIQWELT